MIVSLKESSCITQADYDEAIKELRVTFKSGSVYLYFDVSSQVIYDWQQAASVGSYFCHTIRNYYRFVRG